VELWQLKPSQASPGPPPGSPSSSLVCGSFVHRLRAAPPAEVPTFWRSPRCPTMWSTNQAPLRLGAFAVLHPMATTSQTCANRAGRAGGLNLLGCPFGWHFGWSEEPPANQGANQKGNLASRARQPGQPGWPLFGFCLPSVGNRSCANRVGRAGGLNLPGCPFGWHFKQPGALRLPNVPTKRAT